MKIPIQQALDIAEEMIKAERRKLRVTIQEIVDAKIARDK